MNSPLPGTVREAVPAKDPIVGVLLAAGHARRFGSDKLLYPDGAGLPLGLCAARALLSLPERVAVLPSLLHPLTPALRAQGFCIVVRAPTLSPPGNPGLQSASLRAGVAATSHAAGWVVALADMPRVRVSTVQRIAHQLSQGAALVGCRFEGRRGNPVGLGRQWLSDLLQLEGDRGARALFEAHSAQVSWVEVDDPGILYDVDTLEEGRRWQKMAEVGAVAP